MKSLTSYNHALARLNTFIAEHKGKPSLEREKILQTICRIGTSVTPAEIIQIMKTENISRSTVYNTFKLFVLARILFPVGRADKAGVRYELCYDKPNHIQMICSNCGRKTEIRDTALQTQICNKKYTNFNFRHFTLYIYGECNVCRKRK